MLELKNITKVYPAGDGNVEALKGVSLQFRSSEFVSILGPSGCGKTTMLNIIGGLDQYTSGDLVINGRSTKNFGDRDWDAYRNHSVGFVFQSYNLIPHQTVLENVELALTLSGVSRKERRKRAVEALNKVGLGNQLKKRPNQMSGGQMQRVAIARAIVNDPDIILADEPTGALDTETSVQVMEILHEIARDRLVIMVTHNPELAERYSSRIIRVLDGEITGDTRPLSAEELVGERIHEADEQKKVKTKRPSMSVWTAFGLSLRNLFTKKGRTTLTAFAGSIGIIGIALIYAVSQGTTAYINTMQEDTLSSYPLTLEAQSMDMSSLLMTFMGSAQSSGKHEQDAVYQKSMVYDMVNALSSMESKKNDLKAFKAYLEEQRTQEGSPLNTAVSGVQYTYDMDLLVYTKSVDDTILYSDAQSLMRDLMIEYFGVDMTAMSSVQSQLGISSSMSTMGSGAKVWQEMLPGDDGAIISPLLEKQYDLVYGRWPSRYDEVVLVVDENGEVDDMTLYALGLKPKAEIDELAQAAIDKTHVDPAEEKWSYEDICNMDFRVVLNGDCYTYDASTGTYTDLRNTSTGLKYLYDNGLDLRVTGIIRPSDEAVSAMLTGTIGYTGKLTEYLIEQGQKTDAVAAQLADPTRDIFTGLPFQENTGNLTDAEKEAAFRDYLTDLSEQDKADVYLAIASIPPQEVLDNGVAQAMEGKSREDLQAQLLAAMAEQTGMDSQQISDYLTGLSDEDFNEMVTQLITEQVKAQYAAGVAQQLALLEPSQMAAMLDAAAPDYTTEQCVEYYDEVLQFSDSTYEENLKKLGYVNLDSPDSINLYAASFEDKDVIEEAISDYNSGREELEQISYTDYVGLMMRSVTTIINAITYVLIAFVAVSLVVSSIMIGVITLISVQERTKEIGILRAIGASKANVSSMFNAETAIIGFTSGLLGVGVTWGLCFPINAILRHFTGIESLRAYLPWQAALVLVAISVALTLIAGIIPSRSAAKKDPVVALRSE